MNLQDLGGQVVPGIQFGGDKGIPLVIVPFTPESLVPIQAYMDRWWELTEDDRLPIIKSDAGYIVPPQVGERLLLLAQKRQ